MNPLEEKLHSLVSALDEAALEGLASKGLLRRAQKDLERGAVIAPDGADAAALHFKIDQFRVSIPEAGPAKAKCTCPSAGICQHILAVVLFLKRNVPQTSPTSTPDLEQELLSYSPEQLEQWAGKSAFRAALQLVSRSAPEILLERGLVVRFPSLNAQCHVAPGSGLDGIIASGNIRDERRVVVAAVIAFQKSKGVGWESATREATVLEAADEAPRSRGEVMDSAQQLFAEVLKNGLARVSAAMQQRFATLAVSATGVHLPRLALVLRSLSDECALLVARDARADAGRMLGRLAHAYALCSAIQQGGDHPRADLIGWHRTHYDEVGNLDLAGVAAWPWRTASGYAGLTVLFWDAANQRWNSWSESRPAPQLKTFDPVARYTQPGPWAGAESPRQLARSSFRLMNARRNPLNRLSASGKSRVLVTGPAPIADSRLPVIENWTDLGPTLDKSADIGLKESNPLDAMVALKPAVWAARIFNPVTQVFSWLMADSQKQPLVLEIPFDAYSEPAIKYLEKTQESSLPGTVVIGRLQRAPSGCSLFPFTFHLPDGSAVHLMLDAVEQGKAVASVSNGELNEELNEELDEKLDAEEEIPQVVAISPKLGRLLDTVDENLLALSETGLATPNMLRITRLEQLVQQAERLTLPSLATCLQDLVSRPRATTLLRCCQISQLHRQALSLSA